MTIHKNKINKKFMPLNPKQLLFCQEYLINGYNAKEAALTAGYSPISAKSTGGELLSYPTVREYIDNIKQTTKQKMEEKYNVSKESLIEDLLKIKELCLENPKVTHNSIKAIEVISKMLGYNEPKKLDVTSNGESLNLKDMIDFDE